MRLLFDQNLSPALPRHLAAEFAGSSHVRQFGMATATDAELAAFAAREDYVVVTKDQDFARQAAEDIKVIWIRLGNCTTRQVVEALKTNRTRADEFAVGRASGLLNLP